MIIRKQVLKLFKLSKTYAHYECQVQARPFYFSLHIHMGGLLYVTVNQMLGDAYN